MVPRKLLTQKAENRVRSLVSRFAFRRRARAWLGSEADVMLTIVWRVMKKVIIENKSLKRQVASQIAEQKRLVWLADSTDEWSGFSDDDGDEEIGMVDDTGHNESGGESPGLPARSHSVEAIPKTAPKPIRQIRAPRRPTPAYLKHDTNSYTLFDSTLNNVGTPIVGPFKNFDQYNDYTLLINSAVTEANFNEMVPKAGVRLDDRTAAMALLTQLRTTLFRRWPAEFSQAGMIRTTRLPLGMAYKKWIEAGEVDVDGSVAVEPGWYYMWWGGIHCLMEEEGLDAGLYMIRSSDEEFKCKGKFGFKVGFKAVIQSA